jgi:hypothetical protein
MTSVEKLGCKHNDGRITYYLQYVLCNLRIEYRVACDLGLVLELITRVFQCRGERDLLTQEAEVWGLPGSFVTGISGGLA